ncbi:MAG: alpha/beta hydrolase [Nitrospira sp.]|nr:alpha/beta hydrolase [Nitrospira sp.]MDH5195307.1 alpha/beta hydrolase [Nitrospira sp.]
MKHLGRTPPFYGPDGEILLNSIAEISYLCLGGFDQWVMIRGENIANPILILLHGGPGFPEMRLFRTFNAALEQHYTVVYWMQRGTSKSFDRRMSASSLTIERFIADLDELIDAVRRRFGKAKVALYGHSWGSALGVLYAARFPEKVAAYVGAGQIGEWAAFETASYAFALAEAERRRHRKAIRELRTIGPPPHVFWDMVVERKWITRFVGIVRGMSLWRFTRITLGGPEASIFDLPNILQSQLVTPKAMWPELIAVNLITTAPSLRMPVFFFLGRHDRVVVPETSVAYFDVLQAPSKTLIWFEESGHEPPAEEPEKFNRLMAELVRPAAVASSA